MARIKRAKVTIDNTTSVTENVSDAEIKNIEYSTNIDTTSNIISAPVTNEINESNDITVNPTPKKKSKNCNKQSLADFLY